MRKYVIAGLAASVAVLSLSCRKERTAGEQPIEIRISSEAVTKASGSEFEPGDLVGLYMCDGNTVKYDNVMYSCYGDGFYGYDRMFYPEESEELTFVAYYPYSSGNPFSPSDGIQWSVKELQWEGDNYTDSDFMMARKSVKSGTNPVSLTMTHRMAAIDMILVPGAGYTAESLLSSEISAEILNVMKSCSIDAEGNVSATGDAGSVEPAAELEVVDGALHGISAIVVPQTVPSGTRFLSVMVNGTLYYYELSKDLVLESSEKLVVRLKISDRGVEFSSEITGWNDAPSVSGDLEGSSTVKDADGNEYGYVKIGNQVWLTSNLRTTHFNDGTAIKQGSMMDYMSGSSAFYDVNTVGDGQHYLYSYAAASSGKICPEGWRLPDNDDFSELTKYLGSEAGKATKSTGGWTDGTTADPSYQGDGSTGLDIFPAGFGNSDRYGQKEGAGTMARLWSASNPMFDYGYSFIWRYDSSDIEQDYRTTVRCALSVRCIKE